MTNEEAKHKLDFMKKAYQKLIDEKVDSGKLVGDEVRGEWQAKTPLDEAYKDMIEGLDLAIKALEQTSWISVSERLPHNQEEADYCYECARYGDDYCTNENGDLVCCCPECSFNPFNEEVNADGNSN